MIDEVGFAIGLAVGCVLGVAATLVYSVSIARWLTKDPE